MSLFVFQQKRTSLTSTKESVVRTYFYKMAIGLCVTQCTLNPNNITKNCISVACVASAKVKGRGGWGGWGGRVEKSGRGGLGRREGRERLQPKPT